MVRPNIIRRLSLVVWLAAVSWLVGCGSGELETAPVSGTVTFDGQLLTHGTVIFTPTHGRAGQGDIDGNGRYTIGTYSDSDGAIAGPNKVSVIVREASHDTGFEEDVEIQFSVPARYANPNTSGIMVEVKPGEDNTADITLTSSGS